tara:strand:+ start:1216 stop:1386 length:171 start_codon:yes stop_codon:yes gene_type:complete
MLKKIIMEYLFDEENKKEIISKLNEEVNIPFISEKTEEKAITAVFDIFQEVLEKKL